MDTNNELPPDNRQQTTRQQLMIISNWFQNKLVSQQKIYFILEYIIAKLIVVILLISSIYGQWSVISYFIFCNIFYTIRYDALFYICPFLYVSEINHLKSYSVQNFLSRQFSAWKEISNYMEQHVATLTEKIKPRVKVQTLTRI